MNFNERFWGLLYKAIVNNINTGVTSDIFQMAVPGLSWDWPVPKDGVTGYAQYEFCSKLIDWSAISNREKGDVTFNGGYNTFLNAIDKTGLAPNLLKHLNDAIIAFNNIEYYTKVPSPAPSQTDFSSVPAWNLSAIAKDWVQSGEGNNATVSFINSDPPYLFINTWAGTCGSITLPFWQINSNGSWQRLTEIENNNNLSTSLCSDRWSTIFINPEPAWYDSGTIALFAKGPFKPGYSEFAGSHSKDDINVFGKGGLLPAIKTSMLVFYQPTAKITFIQAISSEIKQQFEAAQGFRIGPVLFGNSPGQSKQTMQVKVDGKTITVHSSSPDPTILGVAVVPVIP